MAIAGAVTAPVTRWRSWLGVAAGFLLLLWLLNAILLPFVVGDRVGLHPVWIMFALPAGASLFGVVGVMVRHQFGRYHASSFYRGSVSG